MHDARKYINYLKNYNGTALLLEVTAMGEEVMNAGMVTPHLFNLVISAIHTAKFLRWR